QAGILAYRDLKSNITEMSGRIEALSAENRGLQDARNSLATDSDRIAREARDIGYIRPGEKIVVLSSSAPKTSSEQVHDIEPLQAGFSTGLPDRMIKILAAMTGIAVLFASLLMSIMPRRRQAVRMTAGQS
ncbi:MAG TPA: septum formation initiator family protein, partial [Rectinemataceae bacterium]|nr:septum formation initiator family protein [Rectinemataceae bacterium]